MKTNHQTPTETAAIGKLRGFFRGVKDYPRYIASHFTTNRKTRRAQMAQFGTGRHNARTRPTYSGWWNGCQRVQRGAAA